MGIKTIVAIFVGGERPKTKLQNFLIPGFLHIIKTTFKNL